MWTVNFQMFKLVLEKAEEPEIKLPTFKGSSKKQESSRKTSISALLTMPKPWTVWITINCGKFWKRWEYQTTWPAMILLTHSSLTSSPSVLLYFFYFNMICIWLYLPYNCAQDSFSKWFEAFSFSVTFYLLSTSTHTHLLCLCLSITRCDRRRSGRHKEKTCRSVSSNVFFVIFHLSNLS